MLGILITICLWIVMYQHMEILKLKEKIAIKESENYSLKRVMYENDLIPKEYVKSMISILLICTVLIILIFILRLHIDFELKKEIIKKSEEYVMFNECVKIKNQFYCK